MYFNVVPISSCRYIDDGKNPQLYTKDCLEKALAQNKEVKGKIDSYQVEKVYYK